MNKCKQNSGQKRWRSLAATLLLLLLTWQANAQAVLEKQVSLSLTGTNLAAVVAALDQQSELSFTYDKQTLSSIKLADVSWQNVSLKQVLSDLGKRTGLEYMLEAGTLSLKVKQRPVAAPDSKTIDVSGTVMNSDQSGPVEGASITIKNHKLVSDSNGRFAIALPAGKYTATISAVGYEAAQTSFEAGGNNHTVAVLLEKSNRQIDDVVVVGYGSQKKLNLTGSVSSINMGSTRNRPITQTSQALMGTAPGLYLNSNSGEAGNDQVNIQIRGLGTLNNANPLILVDGVEAPMNNINPGDIESISVLKDAASASIYGSRAANGVILITTKRGKFNNKSTVNYDFYTGLSAPTVLPEMVTDIRKYLELYREAQANIGSPVSYTDADITKAASRPSTDWIDVIFRKDAPISQHNIAMRGGGQNVAYSFSSSYLSQKALLDGDQSFSRYNARLNLDARLSKLVTTGVSMSYARGDGSMASKQNLGELTGKGSLAFEGGFTQHPLTPVYDSNGRYAAPDATLGLRNDRASGRAILDNQHTKALSNDILGSAFVEVEPVTGLKVRGTLAVNSQIRSMEDINKEWKQYDWVSGRQLSINNEGSNLQLLNESSFNVTGWLQATWEKTFGKHAVKALAGYNQETSRQKRSLVGQQGFGSTSSITFGNGAVTNLINGSQGEWALRSFFARANYAFGNKYLLEVNLRRDGSSRFGQDKRWAMFPAISGGWVVSNEAFWKQPLTINYLKLRGSWGKLGNQNTDLYPFASQFTLNNNYIFNNDQVSGGALSTLGNPDLKWETTTTTDLGIELKLAKSHITIEADYFVKRTDDILTKLKNPLVTGVALPTVVNAASVENKGWEAAVTYQDHIGDLNFSISGNITHVRNKVLAINPTLSGEEDVVEINAVNNTYLMRGQPINSIYGYLTEGIFQSQDEISKAPNHSLFGTPQPGDFRIKDADGDNRITEADRRIMGNRLPEWLYGGSINLNYKGFDLSALFQGIGSADMFLSRLVGPFPRAGLLKVFEERWTAENPSATMPRLWSDRSGYNGKTVESLPSDFWVSDRKYMRVKNIQLGYNFSGAVLRRLPFQQLRIYVNAQNPFTFTGLKNFDPERLDTETYVTTALPQAKVYTVGVNVTF